MTRLDLLYIPTADDAESEDGLRHFIHWDTYALVRLLSIFDFKGHKNRRDRNAILRLRKVALEKQEEAQEADFIELDDHQADLLTQILTSPQEHLKDSITIEGKQIPMRDQILEEVAVVAGTESMLCCLQGEPGLYDEPVPTAEDDATQPDDEHPV